MLSELEQKIACDGVDHVVAVAVGGKFHKIEKVPLIRYLYEAARRKANDEPLSYRAAKGLIERVKPGDNVCTCPGRMDTDLGGQGSPFVFARALIPQGRV